VPKVPVQPEETALKLGSGANRTAQQADLKNPAPTPLPAIAGYRGVAARSARTAPGALFPLSPGKLSPAFLPAAPLGPRVNPKT